MTAGHRRHRLHRRPSRAASRASRRCRSRRWCGRRASTRAAATARAPASTIRSRRSRPTRPPSRAPARAATSSTTSPPRIAKRDRPDAAYTRVNVDGTRNVIDGARAAGARRVVHCSTGGVHGHIEHPPANEDAPFAPGDIYQETKLEAEQLARAECGARSRRSRSSIARPIGIYGPGDTRFLKMFRGIARGTLPDARVGRGVLSPHLHRRSLRGLQLCGEVPRSRGPHLHPRRAAIHDAERAASADGRGARREAAAAAAAGVAVLDRRRAVRGDLRAAAHRAAALSPPRRLLHARAAPSTSRGPAPSWATRPPSISKPACAAPSEWYRAQACCERRRLNVVHICDHLGWTGSRMHGVKRLFAWMIPRFDPARFDVSLVSLRKKDTSEDTLEQLGIDVTYCIDGKFDPATLPALVKVLDRQARPTSSTCTATARRRSGGSAAAIAQHPGDPARARESHDDAVVPADGGPGARAVHGHGDRGVAVDRRLHDQRAQDAGREDARSSISACRSRSSRGRARRRRSRAARARARRAGRRVRDRHGHAPDAVQGQHVSRRGASSRSSNACPNARGFIVGEGELRRDAAGARRRRSASAIGSCSPASSVMSPSALVRARHRRVPVAVGGHAADRRSKRWRWGSRSCRPMPTG